MRTAPPASQPRTAGAPAASCAKRIITYTSTTPRVIALLFLLASAGARAAIVQVQVGHDEFVPFRVTIQPGDTVKWTWTTDHTSSVTSGQPRKPDGLFDSGIQLKPFTFSYTFQNPGHYDYFCRVDPANMYGAVEVAGSAPAAQLLNISTRLAVQTGENVMIGGFIVTGTASKKVLVRGLGPSLTQAGIANALADPLLELHATGGALIGSNNNWKDNQQSEIQATTIPPTNDLESAIVATLPANNSGYTVIVKGNNSGVGVGLVEMYDLDRSVDSKLANISTRGFVQTGTNVMIGGFILGNGSGAAKVLARAIGPSLAQEGVASALSDTMLELRDANGAVVRSNDDWKETEEAAIQGTGVAPKNDLESALLATLNPGSYTAIVAGKNGATGVALVELYNLQ